MEAQQESNADAPHDCPSLFKLTPSQKERIERSKLKAKALKHARLVDRHHHGPSKKTAKLGEGSVAPQVSSAGGYMIDTDADSERLSANYKLVEEEGGRVSGYVFTPSVSCMVATCQQDVPT